MPDAASQIVPVIYLLFFSPSATNELSTAGKESCGTQVESGRLDSNCIAAINIGGSQAAKLLARGIENIPPRISTFLHLQSFWSSRVCGKYHLISSSLEAGVHSWGLALYTCTFSDDWDRLGLGNSSEVAEYAWASLFSIIIYLFLLNAVKFFSFDVYRRSFTVRNIEKWSGCLTSCLPAPKGRECIFTANEIACLVGSAP